MTLRLSFWLVGLAGVFLVTADAALAAHCRFDRPDTKIIGIELMNAESAAAVVGADVDVKEAEDDLPNARFVNKDGSQELVVFSNYSAAGDEFSEFEVKMAGSEAMTLPDLPVAAFTSGSGIELGMSLKQVQQKLGTCVKSREKTRDGEFIQYEIRYDHMSPALRAYGFPVYFAEYEFQGDKLIRFRFGLERDEKP